MRLESSQEVPKRSWRQGSWTYAGVPLSRRWCGDHVVRWWARWNDHGDHAQAYCSVLVSHTPGVRAWVALEVACRACRGTWAVRQGRARSSCHHVFCGGSRRGTHNNTTMLVVRLPASEAVEPPPVADGASGHRSAHRAFTRSSTVGSEKSRAPPPAPTLGHGKLSYEVPAPSSLPAYARESDNTERDLGRLYKSLWEARRIAVVCGAGVSVSPPANIPDFRSATGLFARLKDRFPHAGLTSGKDLFDARLFQSETSTALFYSMMAELKDMADAAQPTLFHHWLKRLDSEGRLQRVYTQNIDGLEEKAGLTLGVGSGEALASGSKRKRAGRSWQRSQSDSAVPSASRGETPAPQPLFPRAIPLHGHLSSLSCMLCSHSQTLDAAHDVRARDALETLRRGDPVWCDRCATADELRTSAGLRSRGVGRMKINVVLYHGENDTAEHVGACVERDLLGLRDPQEPDVPETPAEARARERRMRAALPEMPVVEEGKDEVGDLSMSAGDVRVDDALASAFAEDEKPDAPRPACRGRHESQGPRDEAHCARVCQGVPGGRCRQSACACACGVYELRLSFRGERVGRRV